MPTCGEARNAHLWWPPHVRWSSQQVAGWLHVRARFILTPFCLFKQVAVAPKTWTQCALMLVCRGTDPHWARSTSDAPGPKMCRTSRGITAHRAYTHCNHGARMATTERIACGKATQHIGEDTHRTTAQKDTHRTTGHAPHHMGGVATHRTTAQKELRQGIRTPWPRTWIHVKVLLQDAAGPWHVAALRCTHGEATGGIWLPFPARGTWLAPQR